MRRLLALSAVAALLGSASAKNFELELSGLRRAALAGAAEHPSRPLNQKAVEPLSRVADAATWQSLVNRAVTRPTRVQSARVGDTTYKIYIVTSKTALSGQDCPQGTTPENTLFVSKAVEGRGKHLYPVRVSVACRGEAGVRDSFSLNSDWDGRILEAALYNGSLGLIVHPMAEPAAQSAEPTSMDLFLARLVKQFLDAP